MSSFEIDGRDILRAASKLKGADKVIGEELLVGVRAIGLAAEGYAKQAAPVDRGQLRRSLTSKASLVSGGAQAKVGSNLAYASVVEKGRRPGSTPPPVTAITPWAIKHGINPYVLARSIGRKGIRARPYLKPAVGRAVAEGGRHMRPALVRIRARLLA